MLSFFPEGTHVSINNKYLCEKKINNKSNDECNFKNFIKNECSSNKKHIKYNYNIISAIINEIKIGNMNSELKNVLKENGNEYNIIIEEENIIYQITSAYYQNNKKYVNITQIKFGECENLIKLKYNIE